MTQNTSSQKPLQRILVILSGLAFAGTSIFGMAELFIKASQEPQNKPKTAAEVQVSQLEAVERGYEQVLQKEPENQFALQQLVDIRLQKNDLQGAIAPLEKFLKLKPNNQVALEKLARVRIQMRDAKGAVEPLEKLVKLNPDRADYKEALATVKQQVDKESKKGDR